MGSPAIFDFGAQGPTFGVDGLRIPLGNAPRNGSSYAGVGDATTSYGLEEMHKSAWLLYSVDEEAACERVRKKGEE